MTARAERGLSGSRTQSKLPRTQAQRRDVQGQEAPCAGLDCFPLRGAANFVALPALPVFALCQETEQYCSINPSRELEESCCSQGSQQNPRDDRHGTAHDVFLHSGAGPLEPRPRRNSAQRIHRRSLRKSAPTSSCSRPPLRMDRGSQTIRQIAAC